MKEVEEYCQAVWVQNGLETIAKPISKLLQEKNKPWPARN